MQLNKHTIVIASAGSRKTTHLVEKALEISDVRILITTYTNENVDLIKNYIIQRNGFVPKNIEVMSWFTFLFRECIKPYFNKLASIESIDTIYFDSVPNEKKYVKKEHVDNYYFTRTRKIYRDRVSDFACNCDDKTNGLITKRLEKIYRHIFIDELQDFHGWDFSFIDRITKTNILLFLVGDPRQKTFSTNNARKSTDISTWCESKQKDKSFHIKEKNECYRSNQIICDFADGLYPHASKTVSKNKDRTEHDGVFIVRKDDIESYVARFSPRILRYNKKSNSFGYDAVNIGLSKGNTYDRVLLIPTKPMRDYLTSADISKAGTLPKYYVALTRARYSVAILLEDSEIKNIKLTELKIWRRLD